MLVHEIWREQDKFLDKIFIQVKLLVFFFISLNLSQFTGILQSYKSDSYSIIREKSAPNLYF